MKDVLTLLLRQTTGHRLQPSVQQQHRQPQSSHFTLTGRFFLKQAFTRLMLVLNSSGATCNRSTELQWKAITWVFSQELSLQIKM